VTRFWTIFRALWLVFSATLSIFSATFFVFSATLFVFSAAASALPTSAVATALPAGATPNRAGTVGRLIPIVRVLHAPNPTAHHRDVPATTVLRGRDLRTIGVDLVDSLAGAAGLKAERAGGMGHSAAVRIRASSAQQVTWALEDVPLRSPDGSPFDPADVPLSALARAEVYKGGSPAALGGQAIGGAVRLVLRRPKQVGANLLLGSGLWGTRFFDGAVAWRKFGDGLLAVRGVTTAGDYPYLHDGGTLFFAGDDQRAARRNNDVRRGSAVLRQRVRLGGWQVEARGLAAVKDQGLPGLALYESLGSRLFTHRQDVVLAAARRGMFLPGDRLVAQAYTGWQHTEVTDKLGEQGIPIELVQDVATQSASVRWHAPKAHRLRLDTRLAATLSGLSGQDQAQKTERPDVGQDVVEATVGARWRQTAELSVTGSANAAFVARERFTLEPESAAWAVVQTPGNLLGSGAVAAVWGLIRGLSLRVGARAASRAPNLAELYGNNGTITGNALLRDERALTIDVGVLGTSGPLRRLVPTMKHAAGFGVALFGRAARDLVTLVRVSPVRAVHRNIGGSQTVGAEVSGWYQQSGGALPIDGRFEGNWTVQRARDDSDDPRYVGKPLPFAPLSSLRLAFVGGIDVGAAWLHRYETSADWSWRAGHFADRAATVVIPAISRFTLSGFLRFTPRFKCGTVASFSGGAAFDVLGFPRPELSVMAQCGVDTWGKP
jgi:outer membrane receptor protein involved in Fe transport